MYLSIENVDYTYPRQEQKVLEDISYQFQTGYVYAF